MKKPVFSEKMPAFLRLQSLSQAKKLATVTDCYTFNSGSFRQVLTLIMQFLFSRYLMLSMLASLPFMAQQAFSQDADAPTAEVATEAAEAPSANVSATEAPMQLAESTTEEMEPERERAEALNQPAQPATVSSASSVANSSVTTGSGVASSAVAVPAVTENSAASSVISSAAVSSETNSSVAAELAASSESSAFPRAENIDLKEVVRASEATNESSASSSSAAPAAEVATVSSASSATGQSKVILGVEVAPGTAARLVWTPDTVVAGLAEQTPVLVVNGRQSGPTLCLTGAVHGDELNGIEMIRRVLYQLDPEKLSGTVIGVPVVNLMGFRRNSRYLPDRRDLNRYFPGNTRGSSASRIAHSFFTNIISQCNALVDIHTGSFHRTNLTQLRADLSNESVATLAQSFGNIAVLNSRGNAGSLRSAAVRAGIPSVTVEAGEPMRMQDDIVEEGTRAIETLMAKMNMYGRQNKWQRSAPVYYKSVWVRANQSGILFSRAPLGKRVNKGEVLGTVTDPITNAKSDVVSPYQGRILGMALDQVVLPGFAAYHIGIQTPEAILIEEGLLDDEDGDDVQRNPSQDTVNDLDALTRPQDMDDEE